MPSTKKIVGSGNFNQGLQTYRPAFELPDGASPFLKNIDFYRTYTDVIAKRKGTAKITQLGDSGTTFDPGFRFISGLYQFLRSDGAKFIYAAENNDVYQVDGIHGASSVMPERWTSVFEFGSTSGGGSFTGTGTGAMDGSNVEFATLQDLCVMVNIHIATQKNTGGTSDGAIVNPFSILLGTPPANARYIAAHKGRLFIANTSAGRSRLHWSASGNPNDWVTVGDAGFVDVNIDDGDEITGIASCGEMLFIFKRFSCYFLTGDQPANFTLVPRPAASGCISNRTIKNQGAFLIYLSDQGVHAINQYGLASLLSGQIRIDVENLAASVKQKACGGIWNRRQYWVCFDKDGDGVNDSAYILNLEDNAWTFYDNIKASIFLTLDDFSLYSGGADMVKIRNHNIGEDDEGTIINMEWRSKEYDFEDVFSFKKLQDFFVHMKRLDGKSIDFNVIVDEIDAMDTQTLPLDQTLGSTQGSLVTFVKSLQVEQGRRIQFTFKNSQLNAPVEIYNYTAQAEVIERQFST